MTSNVEKKRADIAALQLEGAARGAKAERRELVEGHCEPRRTRGDAGDLRLAGTSEMTSAQTFAARLPVLDQISSPLSFFPLSLRLTLLAPPLAHDNAIYDGRYRP